MKDVLFIGAMHGNEPIGVRVLKDLEDDGFDFDWMIGNPRAFQAGTRGTDADLNRSAPGSPSSEVYEERRAAELIKLSRAYQFTIDIHGTEQRTGIFLIVTNPSRENLELAARLDIDRIVIWPAFSPELNGPVSEFFRTGLEIECGPMGEGKTSGRLRVILKSFLEEGIRQNSIDLDVALSSREVYEVYGSLKSDVDVPLEEFVEVEIDGEVFTPLLVNSYRERNGITCYKMRKLDTRAGLTFISN